MHHNSGPLHGFSVGKKKSNLKLFINIVNNLDFQITETDFCLQFRESGSESFFDEK